MFINSIPAPELIFDSVNQSDLKPYLQGLLELDSYQPDFIVMVCNTIHLFHQQLQAQIKTELVDLKEEVKNKFKEMGLARATILGTPSTISLGLYTFDGITYLNPQVQELKILTEAIFNFNQGINKEQQREKVKRIVERYLALNSELVVLGCTELSVMLEGYHLPLLDTMDLLIDVVVRKWCQHNLSVHV